MSEGENQTMETDSVFEKVRQKIEGDENTQIGRDFQQSNIQIFVIDKHQLADVLEVCLARSPELFNPELRPLQRTGGIRSFVRRFFK